MFKEIFSRFTLIPRDRFQRISSLAVPIIGGMVSQNILNMVDMAMVGRLGNSALAAVVMGAFGNFFCMSFLYGLMTAVQATSARRKGEGREEATGIYLNTGLTIALTFGHALALGLVTIIPSVYPLLLTDREVLDQAIPYLQILVLSAPFFGANLAFQGYWNAIDRTNLYFKAVVVMHATNIVLNYILIFGHLGFPAMGVQGAATGTLCASAVGFLVYLFLGFRHVRPFGFLKIRPTLESIRSVVRLAVPSGFQVMLDAAGLTLMFSIVGKVGTMELAAYGVLINVVIVGAFPAIGLGYAGATLVGQALGADDPKAARRWGGDVVLIGVVGLATLGIPAWLFPDLILSGFIKDQATKDLARLPMRILGIMIGINAIGYMFSNMLSAMGYVKRVMYVNVVTLWFYFLPLAYLLGPYLGYGLLAIWLMHQVGFRALHALIFYLMWRSEGWTKIKV